MDFYSLLKEELVPALGCTEPIAIAYAAARARELLGDFPDDIVATCSGNVIKNVKGVVVPGSGGLKGIEASAILGSLVGDSSLKLEVLANVDDSMRKKLKALLESNICTVNLAQGVENLFISIEMITKANSVKVEIEGSHTNIVKEYVNDKLINKKETQIVIKGELENLDFEGILNFVKDADYVKLKDILSYQVECNLAIAEEGLRGEYGASVGKTLLEVYENSPATLAKVYAAAGSDARMSGCTMPVVINSGSGNQGLTVSLPVLIYAKHLEASEEKLFRALALSNLVSIYIKKNIGKLSAFCGAVSASCGCGAGIAFLHDSSDKVIANTVINTLANTSGIICDGAKPSCASKIATSVDATIMSYEMAKKGRVFANDEGILANSIDKTIKNVCRVAKEGMKKTDVEILNIMIGK